MAKYPFSTLTAKGLNGTFKVAYESQEPGFISQLLRRESSNETEERYAGIGTNPKAIKWAGEQHYGTLAETELRVTNEKWSDGLIIPKDLWNEDKTGQIATQVRGLGQELRDLQAQIVMDLITGVTTQTGYDSQPLFSATHRAVPGMGSDQSNIHDGSGAGVTATGFVTNIYKAITDMIRFTDERGRTVNRSMRNFVLIYPMQHVAAVQAALGDALISTGGTNTLQRQRDFSVTAYPEPLLPSSGTQYMYLFGVDKPAQKPILMQERESASSFVIGPGSDFWYEKHAAKFGAFWSGGVAPMFWQSAYRVQLAS